MDIKANHIPVSEIFQQSSFAAIVQLIQIYFTFSVVKDSAYMTRSVLQSRRSTSHICVFVLAELTGSEYVVTGAIPPNVLISLLLEPSCMLLGGREISVEEGFCLSQFSESCLFSACFSLSFFFFFFFSPTFAKLCFCSG